MDLLMWTETLEQSLQVVKSNKRADSNTRKVAPFNWDEEIEGLGEFCDLILNKTFCFECMHKYYTVLTKRYFLMYGMICPSGDVLQNLISRILKSLGWGLSEVDNTVH